MAFTCEQCGSSFTLPAAVAERYPGWLPQQCLACKKGASSGGSGARRGGGRRGGRGGGRGGGGTASSREQGLTLAGVRARYSAGPQDGVFTDGAADPNPGPGGWGAVWVVGGEPHAADRGHEAHTTNNQMELTALIAGYALVPPGVATSVWTDSRLCVDTITTWAAGWAKRGWKRKGGEVKNLELVRELYGLHLDRPELELRWIKAHDGSLWNEYADALATAYRREEL